MRLDVYRNLNRGGLSGRAVEGPSRGRVVWRAPAVVLRDAQFRIQPGGQARARREGQRNVHAFIRGTRADDHDPATLIDEPGAVRLRYNPFHLDGFVAPDGRIVEAAPLVAIVDGRIAALHPVYAADAHAR